MPLSTFFILVAFKIGQKPLIYLTLSLCLLTQCDTKDISRSFDADQANRLLSADTMKTWGLVTKIADGEDVFGPCFEDNTLTFVKAAAGDSLYLLGRPITCGSTSTTDTLFKAKYSLIENTDAVFQNEITLTEEKHETIELMRIDQLTSSRLKINYTVDGGSVEEEYSH